MSKSFNTCQGFLHLLLPISLTILGDTYYVWAAVLGILSIILFSQYIYKKGTIIIPLFTVVK